MILEMTICCAEPGAGLGLRQARTGIAVWSAEEQAIWTLGPAAPGWPAWAI